MNDTITAALEQAIAEHRAGRRSDAERLYRIVLEQVPDQAAARHNLAILMAERGGLAEALDHFHAALQADPAQGQYWLSYAKALLRTGRSEDAAAILEQAKGHGLTGEMVEALLAEARRLKNPANLGNHLMEQRRFAEAAAAFGRALDDDPGSADLCLSLGDAFAEAGQPQDAIAAYRRALKINPDFAEAHFHLGGTLAANDRIAEGFAHYMRRAELTHGTNALQTAPEKPHPLHRTRHDSAQRDYLVAHGVVSQDAAPGEIFHIAPGERVLGAAVNPANATPEMLAAWKSSWPQMVVLENFLMPEALEKLRRYCAESTVWKRDYTAGYIGATPQDGFSCPLLAQIAEEIRDAFPEILAPHQLHYLGAFKYDSELSTGTNTHADFSAVNVNFYIAPDEANLDPASGGMCIWDIAAKDEAELRHFNGDDEAARAHVAESIPTIVQHRANRAVIFRSNIFHKTDDCRFADGYLNMRINISLLFGRYDDLSLIGMTQTTG